MIKPRTKQGWEGGHEDGRRPDKIGGRDIEKKKRTDRFLA